MSGPEIAAPREGESGEYPRPFGNYLLLTSLARGGMGEVFLAKSGGIAGIEKHCVVKTLRGNYTLDREYVTRFIDEARVVVQLHHRNICQIYDVGRVGKQYYLAMEYIIGRDLRTIQQRARDSGRPVGKPLVLHVLSEMLEALDYAHRIVDPISGEALRVVHRDVSPQNVMLNFEGEVKLIDFGLAQSAKKVEKTQPHVVMGKMAYMSPEQARGDPVDGRADMFAAAVLAYELMVGERYYEGLSFDQIWSMAGRGGHAPRLWSSLDDGLQAILGRALAPNADDRYPTCADFKEDLVAFQVKTGQLAMSRDTRTFLADLFGDASQSHRELLSKFQNVRMLSREAEPKSGDDSQSFSSSSDHESIVSGAAIADDDTRRSAEAKARASSAPVRPLRPDEKTVSTVLISRPSTSGEKVPSNERTLLESAPVPELTVVGSGRQKSEDRTVIEARGDSEPTAPPTPVVETKPTAERAAKPSSTEHTEAVRPATRAAPLAPTVIVRVPLSDVEEPPKAKRSALPFVAGVAVALVVGTVVGVVAFSGQGPKDVAATRSTTEVSPEPRAERPSSKNDEPKPVPIEEPPQATAEPVVAVDEPVEKPLAAEAPAAEPAKAQAPPPASTKNDEVAARAERRRQDEEDRRRNKPSPRRESEERTRETKRDAVVKAAADDVAPTQPRIVLQTPPPAKGKEPFIVYGWLMQNCRKLEHSCVKDIDRRAKKIQAESGNADVKEAFKKLEPEINACVKRCIDASK